jgi:aspartyl protease family protein
MGIVLVKLKISNPDNGTTPIEVENAVVDTGSVHTCVPRGLAVSLGLRKTGALPVVTASGPVTLDESYAFVELQGKAMMTPLLVSDTLDEVIVGVTLLEWLGFIVDPVRKEIRETDVLFLCSFS